MISEYTYMSCSNNEQSHGLKRLIIVPAPTITTTPTKPPLISLITWVTDVTVGHRVLWHLSPKTQNTYTACLTTPIHQCKASKEGWGQCGEKGVGTRGEGWGMVGWRGRGKAGHKCEGRCGRQAGRQGRSSAVLQPLSASPPPPLLPPSPYKIEEYLQTLASTQR